MGYKERVEEFMRRKAELEQEGMTLEAASEQAKKEATDTYFGTKRKGSQERGA